jgi:hypothetical protein
MDWERIRSDLPNKVRVRFDGRWVSADGDVVVYALPNEPHRQRCEDIKGEVEAALAVFYGVPLTLRLVSETTLGRGPATRPLDESLPPDEAPPIEATVPAPGPPVDTITRLTEAFPGAVVIGEDGRDVR